MCFAPFILLGLLAGVGLILLGINGVRGNSIRLSSLPSREVHGRAAKWLGLISILLGVVGIVVILTILRRFPEGLGH